MDTREEKQATMFQLTLDAVCTQLNAHSDPGVLYCLDEAPTGRSRPLIIKVVRGNERGGLWVVRDRLTERKAREELRAISLTEM